jgi:uncharacterized repeat protein (TIGR01451 family)
MRSKLLTKTIIMLFIISNINIIYVSFINADDIQPQWPSEWVLYDSDPTENGDSDDYRDVSNAYYHVNDYYLYFRLECYGYPNFTAEPDCRYKWFIDIDDPHNMGQSGGNVYEAEYLLFIEDSPKPGGDGIGDIYLLADLNNNGFMQDDWPDYMTSPGPILDSNIAGYKIEDNYIDVYISQENISYPEYSYFTWATDQEDPNLDSAPNIDRSNSYWDADLTKADISIVKSANTDIVIAGELFEYTIQVTNHGPHDVKNVTISDTLPSEVIFSSANPLPTSSNGSIYYWTYPSLNVSESVSITINVSSLIGFTGEITNVAEVYSETHDPIPGNNECIVETEIFEIFYLTTNVDGNGSILINPEKEYYLSGDIVNLTAISDPGWSFNNWSGCINDTFDTINMVMNSDKDLTAHFAQEYYKLNITINGSGTVDKVPDILNYSYGTDVLLNANPASGWKFDHWAGDLTGSENPTNINMTEDKIITAYFIKSENNGGGGGGNTGGNTGGSYDSPIGPVSQPNIPPIAITGGPYYGTPGEIILFNASLSYDPDQYIDSWLWEFGDGTTGEGVAIYHNYSSIGEYIVNLTVIDNQGAISKNITVALIIKPNSPPSFPKIIGPIEGITETDYNFSFVFDDEDNDKIKYIIDWGDGNTSESDFIDSGQFFNVSHRWNESGVYKVTVIGDDNETTTTEDFEITINDPEPSKIPEQNNILLIIILIIGLLILLLFYLLSTGDNRKEEENDKK